MWHKVLDVLDALSVSRHLGTTNIWLLTWPYTNRLRCAINVLNVEINLTAEGL